VFCELLFIFPNIAASERKVVRPMYVYLEQINSYCYVKLIPTTTQEINRRTGSVGQSTLCARLASQIRREVSSIAGQELCRHVAKYLPERARSA
jgi:hypothetical protein